MEGCNLHLLVSSHSITANHSPEPPRMALLVLTLGSVASPFPSSYYPSERLSSTLYPQSPELTGQSRQGWRS